MDGKGYTQGEDDTKITGMTCTITNTNVILCPTPISSVSVRVGVPNIGKAAVYEPYDISEDFSSYSVGWIESDEPRTIGGYINEKFGGITFTEDKYYVAVVHLKSQDSDMFAHVPVMNITINGEVPSEAYRNFDCTLEILFDFGKLTREISNADFTITPPAIGKEATYELDNMLVGVSGNRIEWVESDNPIPPQKKTSP